jgi:cytochrome b561
MTSSPRRYGLAARSSHWILAALILGNIALGLYFVGLPFSPQKLRLFSWHKWIGVVVLPLALPLLHWRMTRGELPLPASMPSWERALSRAAHLLLYAGIVASALSGWLYSSAAGFQTVLFGVLPIPDLISKDTAAAETLRTAHRWINDALLAVVLMHVIGAFKHHLVDRDDVLARMAPFLLLALTATPLFAAAPHPIDAVHSSIRFVSRQMNVPVEGRFRRFSGTVAFDAAKPEATQAQFEVDVGSIDLESAEAEGELKGPQWFDTSRFPKATFTARSVRALGAGRYEAIGALTIKGATQAITAPFTLTSSAANTVVEGQFNVKRLAFRLGEGPWSDTGTVADEVVVRFKFVVPS